jgi:hypothetical protein
VRQHRRQRFRHWPAAIVQIASPRTAGRFWMKETKVLIHHLADGVLTYLAAPTPAPGNLDPGPQEIPGLGAVATMFLGWGKWALIVGGVLGMFICGGMMILGRRNRSSTAVDGATGIPWVLGGLTLGAVAATIVGAVL